ncbi:MAG: ABC transporter substrate-binding protein [bacterium]|nr:ABC transporter substrate-binding protein [bacterium]
MNYQSTTVRVALGLLIIVIAALGTFYVYEWRLQPSHMYHVAIVTRQGVDTYEEAITSYRAKMHDLGYIEGTTISYDIRHFSAMSELPGIIREVVALHPDIISTYSTPATVAAYKETKDMPMPIPVVFVSVGDPVAAGVVKSVDNPGTNVTGLTSLSTELTANRLRLLKEINPDIKRVAFPHSDASLGDAAADKSVTIGMDTAKQLGITLTLLPVKTSDENEAIASLITAKNAEGIVVGGDSLVWSGITAYIAQAIREKIPLAAFDISQIEKGALVGIGPDYQVLGKQAAVITSRILRGTPPSAIAVQVPDKLILAVNAVTAEKIGLTLPSSLVTRADLIIRQ